MMKVNKSNTTESEEAYNLFNKNMNNLNNNLQFAQYQEIQPMQTNKTILNNNNDLFSDFAMPQSNTNSEIGGLNSMQEDSEEVQYSRKQMRNDKISENIYSMSNVNRCNIKKKK